MQKGPAFHAVRMRAAPEKLEVGGGPEEPLGVDESREEVFRRAVRRRVFTSPEEAGWSTRFHGSIRFRLSRRERCFRSKE